MTSETAKLLEQLVHDSIEECRKDLYASWLRVRSDPEGVRRQALNLEAVENKILNKLRELTDE